MEEAPKKVIVTGERSVLTHAELWHASRCVLDAGLVENKGSSWQFLSSIILTAFAVEAYLNHVGPTIIACWSQLERLPPLAKYDLLIETLGVSVPGDKGMRPQQTLTELFAVRGAIAHGRSEVLSIDMEIDLPKWEEQRMHRVRPLTRWESLIQDSAFAQRAREDCEAILSLINASRPGPKEELFAFGMSSWAAEAK